MVKHLSKHKKLIYFIICTGILLFISFFVTTGIVIGNSVKDKCLLAQGRYGGDLPAQAGCVDALIAHFEDESAPYGERNSAIWALGQLGDSRALPVLEQYYTGNIPNREPWNEVISQHELKKAINLTRGSFNATHFVWYHNLP